MSKIKLQNFKIELVLSFSPPLRPAQRVLAFSFPCTVKPPFNYLHIQVNDQPTLSLRCVITNLRQMGKQNGNNKSWCYEKHATTAQLHHPSVTPCSFCAHILKLHLNQSTFKKGTYSLIVCHTVMCGCIQTTCLNFTLGILATNRISLMIIGCYQD